MTANELLSTSAGGSLQELQHRINGFIDAFRGADKVKRQQMISDGPPQDGEREGLLAAVVSHLCRETGMTPPLWVKERHSPRPFFALPARSFALRVRLMIESPAAFRCRNVFVPATYMERA